MTNGEQKSPSAGTPLASAEVIAEVAREGQLAQIQDLNGLDSKIAALLGFSAVLLGLIFQSDLATEHWNALLTVGSISIGFTSALLGYALLLPRAYAFSPNIGTLTAIALSWPPAATHRAIAASIDKAIDTNQAKLRRKARLLQIGVLLLVIALGMVGGRLIYVAGTDDSASKEGSAHGTYQRQ